MDARKCKKKSPKKPKANCSTVVFAVNCGDDGIFTDSNGIKYQVDNSTHKKSTHKDDKITGVNKKDIRLYQSHAWTDGCRNMLYEIPVFEDGNYQLTVKMYNHRDDHNINIDLNREHSVVKNLDVFQKVGGMVAYNETVDFSIGGDEVIYSKKKSKIVDNKICVEFSSPIKHNIMVSAIVLQKLSSCKPKKCKKKSSSSSSSSDSC